jgi:hypothetical protein
MQKLRINKENRKKRRKEKKKIYRKGPQEPSGPNQKTARGPFNLTELVPSFFPLPR